MCLAVPGKIINIFEPDGLKMGKVDFGGVSREVCLAYVPEANVGDYIIVHVGFAISVIDEDEAQARLALIQEMVNLEDELGDSVEPSQP
jgi:hydrogenase expression/formation protein HypC